MSLVNDALKKARLEAARQDAARRGLPMPGAQLAASPRVGSRALAGIGVVAALVVVALLLFLAGRRFATVEDPPPTTIARAVESPAAEATAIDPTTTPAVPIRESAVPAPEPARSESEPTVPQHTQPAPEPPIEAAEIREPAVTTPRPAPPSTQAAPPATETPTPAPAPAATRPRERRAQADRRVRIVRPERPADDAGDTTSTGEPETAVRVLELPGAIRLELGGIAWSEERPFALVNGRVVGPGDVVEKMAVVAITQRHVELQGEPGHYLLRLK